MDHFRGDAGVDARLALVDQSNKIRLQEEAPSSTLHNLFILLSHLSKFVPEGTCINLETLNRFSRYPNAVLVQMAEIREEGGNIDSKRLPLDVLQLLLEISNNLVNLRRDCGLCLVQNCDRRDPRAPLEQVIELQRLHLKRKKSDQR